MWTACDDRTSTCHWCHLIGRSPSWWTWDLRVPTLFLFPYIFIILHADISLAALQGSYTYLLLILTRRPIVCTLVPCLHPHPLHPHVDSCPSHRCPLDNILIDYLCLKPCVLILYKMGPDFI